MGSNGGGSGSCANDTNRFGSLDKMVVLLAGLVGKSRSEEDNLIHLSEQDMNALTGLGPLEKNSTFRSASASAAAAATSVRPAAAAAVAEPPQQSSEFLA